MIKNAYIHLPFCKSKCKYCTFNSIVNFKHIDTYLETLKTQIKTCYRGEKLNTLYFGGGTPSLISPNKINEITGLFEFEKGAEITMECNPEDNNIYDVNRISMGCQTFNNDILKNIGRRHNGEQVIKAVKTFQSAGVENISLDFIYGLPNQTEEMFYDDLKKAVDLGIKHISLYGLKIEHGSYFYKFLPSNIPDNDIQADMYLGAIDILSKNGFNQYEISNFAHFGYESRHNLNYWKNNYYYGFGCGASGYEQSLRYTNQSLIQKYLQNPLDREFEEKITKELRLEEEIFLGLRKTEGIDIQKIKKEYNVDFDIEYSSVLKKYSKYFYKTPHGWALNVDGMLISNEIMSEFV
ncbi:radical SAM family heme chaperone HemW [bacterium]|nr:radical SAM family heme chaperone HemW [bacterium]